MLRIVIRALGITLVTVAGLALAVEARSRRDDEQGKSLAVALDDGGAPGDAAHGQGPASPIAALRAMLLGDSAPPPAEEEEAPVEPEGLAVHRGVPAAASGVQVNRGLP